MESNEFKIPSISDPVQLKVTHTKGEPEKKSTISEKDVKQPCPYIEPPWSKLADPRIDYGLEVLKNGVIAEEIKELQTKSFWTFGRLESCDIYLAHPSISRFHAVLQYRPKLEIEPLDDETKIEAEVEKEEILSGWYIYDLGSTHGSFLNKKQIPSKSYIRVKVGHMIQLGGSTRRFILKGPDYDEEEESALSITEAKQLKLQKSLELIERREIMDVEDRKIEESKKGEGINWGMGEDADEETDLTINPYASTNNEELFLDDPKKTLRGFFDREGLELNYNVDEMSPGTFVCRIDLPIDDANGRQITAEVCHKGKKKDAVLQGALEACRILDRHGVLRTATHESRKRKQNTSDSEDEFLDRTGDVERRKQRKEAASKTSTVNYDDLKQEELELVEKMTDLQAKIDNYHAIEKERKQAEEDDDLDSFMANMSKEKPLDKLEVRKLRLELQQLQKDHIKLKKLIKIAAPVELPPLLTTLNSSDETNTLSADSKKKLNLPLFGKRNKLPNIKTSTTTKPINVLNPSKIDVKSDEEDEMEDDEALGVESKELTSTNKDLKNKKEPLSQIKGPAFIPPEIIKNLQNSSKIPEGTSKFETSKSSPVKRDISNDDEIDTNYNSDVAQPKKKRSRQRARDKYRDNVDMSEDIEEEDIGKYSKWVPPENQAGDGFTELNKKFGY